MKRWMLTIRRSKEVLHAFFFFLVVVVEEEEEVADGCFSWDKKPAVEPHMGLEGNLVPALDRTGVGDKPRPALAAAAGGPALCKVLMEEDAPLQNTNPLMKGFC